MVGYFYSQRAI